MKSSVLLLFFLILSFSGFSSNQKQDSLKALIKNHNNGNHILADTAFVNTINHLAYSFFPSRPDSLMHYAQIALQEAQNYDYKLGKARAYRFIGVGYYAIAEYDDALKNYFSSVELLTDTDNLTDLASNYNNIAIIYDIRGDNETALDYYFKSLEINRERNFERGIAYNLINIGIISVNLGRILQAIDAQMEALKIAEKINDKNGMALALNNLASIYITIERREDAIEKNRLALQIRKEIDDKMGIASSLYSIGYIHMQNNQPDSAIYYFDQSYALSESADDKRNINQVLVARGDIALNQNNLSAALEFYQRALDATQSVGDQYNTARILAKIAHVKLDMGQMDNALQFATRSRNIGVEIENQRILQVSAKAFADVYEAKGDIGRAFGFFKEYTAISDSLSNSEILRRSTRMDAEYEYLKKESEWIVHQKEMEMQSQNRLNRQIFIIVALLILAISLGIILLINFRNKAKLEKALDKLKTTNIEIAHQKEQLQQQAEDLQSVNLANSRLFSIISHDMKGPLAYAVLAIEMIINKEQEDGEKALHLIKNNIDNVYTLMENLLEWSKIQMNKASMNIKNFDLLLVYSQVSMAINSQVTKKDITIVNDLKKDTIVLADENMIEIVMRNLLTNAIKFSEEGEQIRIFAEEKQNEIHVCIKDQGIGIKSEDIPKLFDEKLISKQGTANEKGSGLGLKLCKEMLEKNYGSIWIESEPQKGSSVWFSLPKGIMAEKV